MKIQSLGHSCFIVEIAGDRPEPVRILADPWITDHVIGDLCGRYPRIRADWSALAPIDAIYLSHAHTDHLDPYSLLALAKDLPAPPLLLLPESLTYLAPLLAEELPAWPQHVLSEGVPFELHGVEISALFNLETHGTNEDDVMVLVVRNAHEVLVSEADAILPFQDPAAREAIASLFVDLDPTSGPVSRVFLTTKNELGGTMTSLRAANADARREAAGESAMGTLGEAEDVLAPVFDEEGDALAAPWDFEGVVRLIIGQGIAAPVDHDAEWNRVLFPISLPDRARFESQVAEQYELELPIEAMLAGEEATITGGSIERAPVAGLECLDREEDRAFDPDVERFESDFAVAPLIDTARPVDPQKERIRAVLNERFLPWWVGARNPPVEHLLARYGGSYRIRVRYGTSDDFSVEDFIASFARLRFTPTSPTDDPEEIQEEYWANDLEDYLDGRADDFSTFCRRPPGGTATQLWDCLGFPYLNDDLVEKKVRFHFARAREGFSGADWVLPIWRGEVPPGV